MRKRVADKSLRWSWVRRAVLPSMAMKSCHPGQSSATPARKAAPKQQRIVKSASLSSAQKRKYKKLKKEIIAEVKSLRLNQARIDALVEQLYDINQRLVGYEGWLMRLAENHGVSREDFLKNYQGSELREVSRVTLLQSFTCVRLALWDVSFPFEKSASVLNCNARGFRSAQNDHPA